MFHAEIRLRALMLASLAGDSTAYRQLLQELSAHLRSYFRRRLRAGGGEVEDLVQETLIALNARRASYATSKPFTPWVLAIARYRMIDHLRRAQVRETALLQAVEGQPSTEDLEQAATEWDVERMLSLLPARQRAVIRMSRLEGRSIEETAEMTGQSQAAIKVSIHRGLRRLRAYLLREDAK